MRNDQASKSILNIALANGLSALSRIPTVDEAAAAITRRVG
jgi:hypothetical protein